MRREFQPSEHQAIGKTIREARLQAGFTQRQIAIAMQYRQVPVSQQTISDWERGRSQPNTSQLRLFQALVNSRKIKDWF